MDCFGKSEVWLTNVCHPTAPFEKKKITAPKQKLGAIMWIIIKAMNRKYDLRIEVSYTNGDEYHLDLYGIDNFIKTGTDDGIVGQIFCGADTHGHYYEDTEIGMCSHRIAMADVVRELRWMFHYSIEELEPTEGERVKFKVPKKYNFSYQLKEKGEPFDGIIKQP